MADSSACSAVTTWILDEGISGGFAERTFVYGDPGDIPVAGDWNCDGDETPGVYRNGVFYLSDSLGDGQSAPTADYVIGYGNPGDRPVIGDWNNDCYDEIGVYRGGGWYSDENLEGGAGETLFTFGNPTDTPLVLRGNNNNW